MKSTLFLKALALVALAIFLIAVSVYSSIITSRGYLEPVGEYIYKYSSHGGVIYVNYLESVLMEGSKYGIYIVAAVVIVIAFIWKRKK